MSRLIKIPVSYCEKCNSIFLNDKLKRCLICGNKRQSEPTPQRYQYRDIESMQSYKREWFESSIDINLYKGDFKY